MDLATTTRQDNIVSLKGDVQFARGHSIFEPNKQYRSIILSNEGQMQVLVYGEIFSGEEFNKLFKIK